MHQTMRTCVSVLALAAASAMAATGAAAQQWPTQPIRIVVPNPPGGLPDVLSRSLADPLRARLGQPIIIENRPGANAGIGAAAVTSSKPDGYTFIMSDNAIINISHHLNAQLPFDRKDLQPIVMVARSAIALGTATTLPVTNFKEFIDHVRANPGKVNYGSIGVGSFHHLSMEAIQVELKVKLNHIPYKGSGESVTALRAGHIDAVFASFAGLTPAIKSGQARLIAQTSAQRTKQAPDVPSIAETIPGFDLPVTQSLFGRTGTPAAISARMTEVMAEVVKLPEIGERFAAMGIEPAVTGAAELQKFLDAEAVRIKKIVDGAGLKPN
jgi:tripartite-type tricarboxylate transporter receptor subunit TctC